MHARAAAAGNQTHPMHPSTPIDLSFFFFFFFLPASIHATTKELLLIITGRKKITRQKLSFDLIGVHELYRPVVFALQIVAVFVFPEVVQRINAVALGSQRPEFAAACCGAAAAAALYYCKHPPPPLPTIFFTNLEASSYSWKYWMQEVRQRQLVDSGRRRRRRSPRR
jgi:hypothetical protein